MRTRRVLAHGIDRDTVTRAMHREGDRSTLEDRDVIWIKTVVIGSSRLRMHRMAEIHHRVLDGWVVRHVLTWCRSEEHSDEGQPCGRRENDSSNIHSDSF